VIAGCPALSPDQPIFVVVLSARTLASHVFIPLPTEKKRSSMKECVSWAKQSEELLFELLGLKLAPYRSGRRTGLAQYQESGLAADGEG
jgi:hypothetical protein